MSRVWYNTSSSALSSHSACAEQKLKLKTIDQNGVKDFYEIEDWQQCELLIDLIELIGSNNVSSLEKLSKKKGEAPQQIWANICKSRGIELCTIPERILVAGQPTDSQ